MKTLQELYGMCATIYNESCDGIAELMRSHNLDEINLKEYEDKYFVQLPALQIYTHDSYLVDGDDEGYITARPVTLRLVPGHIDIELDCWNAGGYLDYINETNLSSLEALQLYRAVDEIIWFMEHKDESLA